MPKNNFRELSAMDVLQGVRDGTIDPALFQQEDRLPCIEIMLSEGVRKCEMARILKVSDRTIRRDLEVIAERNALSPSVKLAQQIVGTLLQKAENSHAHLTRIARSKEASPADKAMAEALAWKVQKEFVEKFQTLGMLPLKPQEVVATLVQRQEEETESFEDMRRRLDTLENNASSLGKISPEMAQQLNELRLQISKTEIAQKITNFDQKIQKEASHDQTTEAES